jgi:hypothetical protein
VAHYYITIDCAQDIAKALNALMVERGAKAISDTEWIMEAASHEAIEIYDGITSIVGSCAVLIKELKNEGAWDGLVITQDLFFDLLRSS